METAIVGSEGLPAAKDLLIRGEAVAIPTETVYGLAADALDPMAVARIFEAKERPFFDPLIVHLPDPEWIERIADDLPPLARTLIDAFWPGPLTVVLKRKAVVPDLVTSGLPTVAVRMSAHPLFRELLGAFGKPLAAPSANRFGRISPTTATDVLEELGGRIPLILDGGRCAHGIESTIVHPGKGGITILRHGPVTAEALARFGPLVGRDDPVAAAAPGQLESHYAPGTPLRLAAPEEQLPEGRIGLLAFHRARPGFDVIEILSPRGDLIEAAARFFAALRRLDRAGLDAIVAERLPEIGVGVAMMERLRKAAHR
jgi:L-threonylcarbamoyladenylate synthase